MKHTVKARNHGSVLEQAAEKGHPGKAPEVDITGVWESGGRTAAETSVSRTGVSGFVSQSQLPSCPCLFLMRTLEGSR